MYIAQYFGREIAHSNFDPLFSAEKVPSILKRKPIGGNSLQNIPRYKVFLCYLRTAVAKRGQIAAVVFRRRHADWGEIDDSDRGLLPPPITSPATFE
jgi:hypothetical protein